MRKWILSFLILLLLMPVSFAECNAHYKIIGGGGGPPYSPYSFSKTFSTTGVETEPGCTLSTDSWWSSTAKCGSNLRILCDGEYEGNNVSISLSTSSIYFLEQRKSTLLANYPLPFHTEALLHAFSEVLQVFACLLITFLTIFF